MWHLSAVVALACAFTRRFLRNGALLDIASERDVLAGGAASLRAPDQRPTGTGPAYERVSIPTDQDDNRGLLYLGGHATARPVV